MSFNEQTEKLVNDLIQAEYKNAVVNFGEKYNSLHEGYAVLLEEVEEVKTEITQLLNSFDVFWLWVKRNNQDHKYLCVEDMYKATENAMLELAQVGAVLMKIKNTLPEETAGKRKVCSKDCEYINRAYGSYFCNGQKNAPCVNLGDDCYYNDKTEEPKF